LREHVLEPCGLLFGDRPYLLAVKRGKADAAVWRLDRSASVSALGEGFTPRPGFDPATLTRDCFGIWREAPHDVLLRFSAKAASEALNWRFHPSQLMMQDVDGSLLVKFRAGGMREMTLHLAGWGEDVEVLSPELLRRQLAEFGARLVRRHGLERA
jgi:predicted DNA-binding transcriptional regulator YafY